MSVHRCMDEKSSLRILDAELQIPTGGIGFFDLGKYANGETPEHGNVRLVMKMENSTVEYLEYYNNEITILACEVIGKTLNEAWDLYFEKDKEYLQGGI